MPRPCIDQVYDLMVRLNHDCGSTGESVVAFTDVEYCTDQIANSFEVNLDVARALAVELSSYNPH